MGDKLGSFAFCLAVHPAYVEVKAKCPNVVLQAATDDLKGYARDPHDLLAMFPVAADALRKHAGVVINPSKSAVLLAKGHPDLDAELIPDGVDIRRDGTVVVGAAVGTDRFVQDHLMAIVCSNAAKLTALELVDPQSALLLLSSCLVPVLGYHLQVTPPRLALAAAHAWDAAIDAARSRIMSDPTLGRAPRVGDALQDLADRKARLPLKKGGLGHYSAVLLSPISFYAAYAHHASLDAGTRSRLRLRELALTMAALSDLLPKAVLDEHVVPAADLGLKRPIRKLQGVMTRAAHDLAHSRLVDAVPRTPSGICDRRVLQHPTDAWLPFFVAPTSSELAISPEQFTAGLRFYLLLPQLLRLSSAPAVVDVPAPGARDFSYDADLCRHHPNRPCDRHLVHAHACPASSKQKISDRHELVKRARSGLVREAGLSDIRVEPRTSTTDQRRADIFCADKTAHVHVHYYTDDTVGHPLAPTYIACKGHSFNPDHAHGEAADPYHTLAILEAKKATAYASKLAQVRAHPAVLAGLRAINYKTCAFTSLGAYGKDTVKSLNGLAGYLKKQLQAAARLIPRADGRSVQFVVGRFRFAARAKLQAALLQGNSLLATEVGL